MTTPTDTAVAVAAAVDFTARHARLLDRRRLALLLGTGSPQATLAALAAYRNADGGYGWGLEPDLRSATSQPGAALHAFEVFAEVAPVTDPDAVALCDWLASISLPDGGLPFALPIPDPAGTAAWWEQAPQDTSSLQITAIVAAVAHRVARHDPAVETHPWLARATAYCLAAAQETADGGTPPHALVLAFTLQFLDAVHDTEPAAGPLIDALGRWVPADGVLPVEGGTANEAIRALGVAPEPGRPVRRLFRDDVVQADLRRLATGQDADGGWHVDFAEFSPAGSLEWRGHATVSALQVLRANGLLGQRSGQ